MSKYLLSIMIVILFIFSASYSINLKGCYKKYIKFSAYYSPIKGQNFYYKGNYRKETKLNGRGTHGASGKAVFNGMLAAPKNYKFGTKIYIPGLGIGQVEDRGGAIVNAGQRGEKYDRIDIWVGKGEKALMRALSFGKQVRLARICPPYKKLPVGFDYSKFPIYKNFFQKTLWGIGLYVGRKDAWVENLQLYLKKLGFYNYKITGYFGKLTKKAVSKFQKTYGIKTKYYGYFGPKTRHKLKEILEKKGIYKDSKEKVIEKSKIKKTNIQKKIEKEKISKELALLKRGLGKGYNTYEVKILQKYLKKLGYYKGKINGYYGLETIKAVSKFQLDHGIISKENEFGAGFFGPKTRYVFKKVVNNKFIKS